MAQYDFSLDLLGEERKERRAVKGSRWNEAPDASSDSNHIDGFSSATSKSMIKKHNCVSRNSWYGGYFVIHDMYLKE